MALMPFELARQNILALAPSPEPEVQPLALALGRVLHCDVVAPLNVPGFDNSAMDGYALRWQDLAALAQAEGLPIGARITAGDAVSTLPAHSAARIFTGAPVPHAAELVLMQEQCRTAETSAGTRLFWASDSAPATRMGQNIRRLGEDLRQGQVVLPAGTRLNPVHLGLLASLGLAEVQVNRRLKVGLFSTGNELATPGTALQPGQIYNSNRPMLVGLLTALGVDITDLGTVADNLDATCQALAQLQDQDLILTTGGVSVGEEDHVKAAVLRLGQLDLWKIAIKPGKPFALGQVGTTRLMGLPGNPVSALITFVLLVRPYLCRAMGRPDALPSAQNVIADFAWPHPDSRREFLRAQVRPSDSGLVASLFPHQGSGVLTSCAQSDGLLDLAPLQAVQPGDVLPFIAWSQLL